MQQSILTGVQHVAFSIFVCTCFFNGIVAEDVFEPVVNFDKNENSTEKNIPNVIILLADDLGYGDLSFSGHPTSRTKNLDYLARRSKFFTKFYVTSPICSPSRSSLLTGRYQVRSGTYPGTYIPTSVLGLPHNETTIASILKSKGYATQIVGKWHLGVGKKYEFLPTQSSYGFDNYFGIPYSQDMGPCPVCFAKNRSCYDDCWDSGYVSCPIFENKKIVEQPAYLPTLTQRLVHRASKFIVESSKAEKPFFLYFPFHHIHHPQFSSPKFENKSERGIIGSALLEMDAAVGSILQVLTSTNILNNTIIWFTSDNGPSLRRHERGGCAGPLRCGKGVTFEGGVRVPAFVYWKGKILPGRSNALTSTLDILPTIAKLTATSIENLTLDGVDISPLLFSTDQQISPRDFFAVYPESPTQEHGPYAIIYKNYKAHFYTKGSSLSDDDNYDLMCRSTHNLTSHDPPLLYDIDLDPGERYNLSQFSNYTNIIRLMNEYRRDHMENMTWMTPRTQILDQRSQPCCKASDCEPYPMCCNCSNSWFRQ